VLDPPFTYLTDPANPADVTAVDLTLTLTDPTKPTRTVTVVKRLSDANWEDF
jgi:hypothetical protein